MKGSDTMDVRPAAALFVCVTLTALTACGGGGGGTMNPPQPSPSPSRTTMTHLTCGHTFSAARAALTAPRIANMGARFPANDPETIAPGLLSVHFQGGSISPQAQAALNRMGARQIAPVNAYGVATYSISGSDPRFAAASLSAIGGIAAAGPVIYRQRSTTTPNDPFFSRQWDMDFIGM